MTTDLLIANGATWAFLVLMLVALTALMLVLLRVTDPLLRLRTWHGVVVLALALPAVVPWRSVKIDSGLLAASSGGGAVSWSFWILSVVVGGFVLRGFWLAGAMAKLAALRRSATWWRPDWFDDLAREVGASATPGTSEKIRSAVTFGFRRPAILVPDSLAVAPETQQRAVVAHELHHVVRRDWLWVLGEEAVRTTFWWHPGVWFALAEARQAREELVDRKVIGVTGNRESYVEALVAAARPQQSSVGAFVPHFYRRHQLKARIHRLLKENDMSPRRMFACTAMLVLALPATAWAASSAFPFISEAAAPTVEVVAAVVPQDPPPPPPPAPPAPRVVRSRMTPRGEQLPPPPPPPAPPAQDAPRLKRRSIDMPPLPPQPPPPPARVKRLRGDVPPPPPAPDAPRVKRRVGDAPPPPPPAPRRVVKRSPAEPPPPPPPPKKIIKG